MLSRPNSEPDEKRHHPYQKGVFGEKGEAFRLGGERVDTFAWEERRRKGIFRVLRAKLVGEGSSPSSKGGGSLRRKEKVMASP